MAFFTQFQFPGTECQRCGHDGGSITNEFRRILANGCEIHSEAGALPASRSKLAHCMHKAMEEQESICRKRERFSGRGKRQLRRRANSCARRWTTYARASMAREARSRRLQLGCRR